MKTMSSDTNLELMHGQNVGLENCYLNDEKIFSSREFEVLKLLAQGCTNKEIAKILYVSVHTVKSHVETILRTLNAKNRTNSVYIAMQNNLIK